MIAFDTHPLVALCDGRDAKHSAAVQDQQQLKVWTYDREFRTTWRRPNGTAIPVALPVR